MSLAVIEKMGEMLCETIDFIKKELGVKNTVLDKADEICQAVLPDLEHLSTDNAMELAQAAYDAIKKVHAALTPPSK